MKHSFLKATVKCGTQENGSSELLFLIGNNDPVYLGILFLGSFSCLVLPKIPRILFLAMTAVSELLAPYNGRGGRGRERRRERRGGRGREGGKEEEEGGERSSDRSCSFFKRHRILCKSNSSIFMTTLNNLFPEK